MQTVENYRSTWPVTDEDAEQQRAHVIEIVEKLVDDSLTFLSDELVVVGLDAQRVAQIVDRVKTGVVACWADCALQFHDSCNTELPEIMDPEHVAAFLARKFGIERSVPPRPYFAPKEVPAAIPDPRSP